VLRIVLLLVAAREGNDIVAFIYTLSDIFVAPFRGILGINEVAAGAVGARRRGHRRADRLDDHRAAHHRPGAHLPAGTAD
jgi:hypothetical protein